MKLKIKLQGRFFLFLMLMGLTCGMAAQDIEEELSGFSEIKVYNGVEVELIPSDRNSISITGHSKEKVKFEVVENRLEIKLSLENIWADDNTLVTVYASSVEVIDANEGSIVDVKEKLEGQTLTFRAQEGAAIYAQVNSERLSAKAVTAGIVQLRGMTKNLNVEVNTGGKFFGEDLKSEEAEVSTGTGGQVDVNASEYVKATARLGGAINVYGNPAELDSKTSLGGKITKMN